MKHFRILAGFLLLVFVISFGATAYAADYTYTIRIYSGDQGQFTDGRTCWTYTGLRYGSAVGFSNGSVVPTDPDKYYVKGIRESGKDNNTYVSDYTIPVTRDQDFVVAYGIRGAAVAYTIHYVDRADGRVLAPPVTYYGNPGDRPATS